MSIINVKIKDTKTKLKRSFSPRTSRTLAHLGIKAGEEFIQRKADIDAGTALGSGKLLEIAESAKSKNSDLLVFDFELSAGRPEISKKLPDSMSWIEFMSFLKFLRVTLAPARQNYKLRCSSQYLLPLGGTLGHFSRQRGGVGVRGGEGEQQIELDRRIVRSRIETLKDDLELVANRARNRRKTQKQGRHSSISRLH